jgi:CHAD domain-containing protein
MAYRFTLKHTVAQNARRIALAEVEGALSLCGNEGGDREEIVHDVRKKCKRLRGLIRLVRGPLEADGKYDSDNAFFRDAARELGSVRDSTVMVETYDKVLDRFALEVDRRHFAPIRRSLTLNARAVHARDDLAVRLAVFRDRMLEARERIEDWHIDGDGFEAVREGFARTYRRGRKFMAAAYDAPSEKNFHEWRKHAKYHWYHMRLLEPVWKSEMKARRKAAKKLGEILGDHHDIAMLKGHLAGRNGRVGEFDVLMERRAVELAAGAHILGERLYAAKPKALAAEIGGWWHARLDEIRAKQGDDGPSGLAH